MRLRALALGLAAALSFGGVAAAQRCASPGVPLVRGAPSVLIVMDASRSMAKDAGDGRSRLEVAKAGLRSLVEGLPAEARVGLRLYGHRVSGTTRAAGCRDTELVQPVGPLDREALLDAIGSYEAVGSTPIGRALRAGAADLPREGPRTLVLVSDGGDNCAPPGPCSVARELAAEGTGVTIQAVGLQVEPRVRRQLECIARAGGGEYRDAQDAEELALALRLLASRPVELPEPDGRAVEGGAAPPQAARVGPGALRGEVPAGGERWFRVRVGRGQRLAVRAALTARCETGWAVAGRVAVQALDPCGRELALRQRPNLFSYRDGVTVEPLGLLLAPAARTEDVLVGLRLQASAGEVGEAVPFALALDVAGRPPAPPRTEAAAAWPSPAAVLGGALAGALLVAALRRRRRA